MDNNVLNIRLQGVVRQLTWYADKAAHDAEYGRGDSRYIAGYGDGLAYAANMINELLGDDDDE